MMLSRYDTRRSCSGPCQDISSTVFQGDPGPSRLGSMCQAKRYINSGRSTRLDGASPIDASNELLSLLPPLLLIVGSAEVLLGENIAFVRKA